MSYDIVNEHGDGDQVATITGWSDFCDWADTLDIDKYPEIKHFCVQGWERDLDELRDQLEEASKVAGVSVDIVSTASGIIDFINNHPSEIVMIGNGQDPDE